MGLDLETLVFRVSAESYYEPLFRAAFGDANVNTERISNSLAQFVRSLVRFESKYDGGRAEVNNQDDDFPNFSASENLGKRIFLTGRGGCDRGHGTKSFISDRGATNNG